MEKLKRMAELARSPRGALWAAAYVLLMGFKPWAQDKVQKLIALAPLDFILVAIALAAVYVLFLPGRKKSQFKDIWEGGSSRVQSREAIASLKLAIDRCSIGGDADSILSARMAFCMAMLSFQATEYEEAMRTAIAAKAALDVIQRIAA